MTNEEREKATATAIEAFEYQIKRSEDVKCRKCDECGANPFEDYCIKDVAKWLSLALEALKQEPCEDAISRKAVLDATVKKNSTWNAITNANGENLEEIINSIPSVSPKLSECEDAISREEANKLVDELARAIDDQNRHYPKRGRDIAVIARDIERLPRVTPIRKRGTWIANYDAECDDHGNYPIECSVCGACGGLEDYFPNFCHKCGADMRSEQK